VADVDFATCEQPDQLIQLAWNAGLDKKAVIREGIDAAGLLLAGERNNITTLFWPVPRPLEAADRWSENTHAAPPLAEKMRPYTSAIVPGCVLGVLVTQLFVQPRTSQDHALTALVWIIPVWIAILGVVFKVLIEAAVRRQVARLDEDRALAIVLEQLRLGMTVNAGLVPRACVWIRRGLAPQTGAPR
jgi:hypothetical protein